MFRVKTLERQTEDSFARERLLALLTSYFGGFAVLLACIGLYGLMSYGVTQRTAEMGLRMALGAPAVSGPLADRARERVDGVAGAAIGLVGVFGVVRLVQSQLFGVQPHDPVRPRRRDRAAARVGDGRRVPARPPRLAHRSVDGVATRVDQRSGSESRKRQFQLSSRPASSFRSSSLPLPASDLRRILSRWR